MMATAEIHGGIVNNSECGYGDSNGDTTTMIDGVANTTNVKQLQHVHNGSIEINLMNSMRSKSLEEVTPMSEDDNSELLETSENSPKAVPLFLEKVMVKTEKDSISACNPANTCKWCGKVFAHPSMMTRHERSHTGVKPFTCIVCGKQYALKSTLVAHVRSHTGEKPYACSFCDEKFATTCARYNHVKIHTGDRQHECKTCGRKFLLKGALVNHLRIHTGERPYACGICDKAFASRQSYSAHMKTHDPPPETPFVCGVCNKEFQRKVSLDQHVRRHGVADQPNE